MSKREQDVSCVRCFVIMAPYAVQVVTRAGRYHRDCYESLYLRRHGKRPLLVPGSRHERHLYRLADRAA